METGNCFFVSDLHGHVERYEKLFTRIKKETPDAVFIGGDILPHPFAVGRDIDISYDRFVRHYFTPGFHNLKKEMGETYPQCFVILGNDDSRGEEAAMLKGDREGLWNYCHFRCIEWGNFTVIGYTFVPPTPFRLKDWERYDVTRFVRPGCIAPEQGIFTVDLPDGDFQRTIEKDLKEICGDRDLSRTIFLFHSPPHRTLLDRAGLDGQCIDGVRIDVHVGSTAIQRFIKRSQPLLTLHGHIHESTRITGSWQDQFGKTHSFNASHDGPELSLIRFNPHEPGKATRDLL